MAKAYKQLAEKLLAEKISLDFPDFVMDSANISKGEILLSNENSEIELHFNDDGTYALRSIKIKTDSEILVDNDKLVEIHGAMAKGVKI
jgi:hypothetical protein